MNPYGVQYKGDLLPNLIKTPPPEVLREQARQTLSSWLPSANYNRQNSYQPMQYQTLQGTIQTPPPEELRAQMGQMLSDYGADAARYIASNIATNAASLGLTGKSLGQWATYGGNRALMSAPIQAGIAGLAATRLGAPIVERVERFARSPAGRKTKQVTEKIIDWAF